MLDRDVSAGSVFVVVVNESSVLPPIHEVLFHRTQQVGEPSPAHVVKAKEHRGHEGAAGLGEMYVAEPVRKYHVKSPRLNSSRPRPPRRGLKDPARQFVYHVSRLHPPLAGLAGAPRR